MKLRFRYGALIAVLMVAVALVVGIVASRNPDRSKVQTTAPSAARTAPDQAGLKVSGLEATDRDENGNLRWQIKSSGKMDFDREQMVARGQNVTWELIRADGAQMQLVAPEFVADYRAKLVTLTKGVKAESTKEGFAFQASQVVYDMAAEHLHASGPVTARLGDYDLKSKDLGFDRQGREVTLVGAVALGYQDYHVTAGRAVAHLTTREATLSGSPRLQRGDYVARAGTVQVNAETQQVHLTNAVRVSRGDLSARAGDALFGKLSQQARLSGDVTLTGNGFTATGRRLVVDGEASTATLSGGARLTTRIRR